MFQNKNHTLHIKITKNNTVLTLADSGGHSILWQSAGSSEFKGARKKGKVASVSACDAICKKVTELDIKKLNVVFKGQFKNWKRALLKTIVEFDIKVVGILDATPIPFNGCRYSHK
jgi:small subunit ribosomal protein S11